MTVIDKIRESVAAIQENNVPYFYMGKWSDAASELNDSNVNAILQGKLFPFIFLYLDINEDVNAKSGFNTASVYIYLIKESEENVSHEWRHDNSFPELRIIETDLLKSFKNKGVTIDSYKRIEWFYDVSEANKLNADIDVIQLSIPNFIYYTKC